MSDHSSATTEPNTAGLTDEIWRVRTALWLVPASAVMLIVALMFRGRLVDPAASPLAFAAWAETSGFTTGMFLLLAALVPLVLGFLALMVHTSRGFGDGPGLAGFVLATIALVTFLPYVGVMTLAGPAFAGQYFAGDLDALVPLTTLATTGLLYVSGITYIAASAMFALAIWRSDDLPKWTAVVLLAHAPLLTFAGTFTFLGEVLGAVLLLAAGVGIATEVAFGHRVLAGTAARPKAT